MNTPPAISPRGKPAAEKRGRVYKGMDIPFFSEGPEGPQINSAEAMNVLVAVFRAWSNPTIVYGDVWDIQISDSGVRIQVGKSQTAVS